jgi:hypothetical protein
MDEGPLASIGALASQDLPITPTLRHLEIYSPDGLLTVLWHGHHDAERVVLMGGGAMGGLLGPADGLYHDLGEALAANGIGVARIGYRVPNDLERCKTDMLAVGELAGRFGATSFVTVGHSFGGAVAVQAATALGAQALGVVTLATQSAGCEVGEPLDGTVPVILFHGDQDQILPFVSSQMVQMICGGELVLLPGSDHMLQGAEHQLRERLMEWIPARFARDQ